MFGNGSMPANSFAGGDMGAAGGVPGPAPTLAADTQHNYEELLSLSDRLGEAKCSGLTNDEIRRLYSFKLVISVVTNYFFLCKQCLQLFTDSVLNRVVKFCIEVSH